MAIFIKGRIAALGLTVLLAGPAFGQASSGSAAGRESAADSDSALAGGKRIHFTDISVRDNDGKHKTYSVLAEDDAGNAYRLRKVDGSIVLLEVNSKPVPRDQYARYDELLGHFEKPVPPAAPVTPSAPAAPATPAAPAASAEPVTPVAPVAPGTSPTVPAPPASPLPPTPPAPPEPPRANKYTSHIIDDLINKNIITDESKLTFSLDDEQMTVNGTKQPDDVFRYFKEKYIKHAGDHFRYERQGSSAITNIKIDDDNH